MNRTPECEAASPPVVRWADLPDEEAVLAREGFEAWQMGRLGDADVALSKLLRQAREAGSRDARFHALHLLACVAFSAGEYARSRVLHEEVLQMSQAIGFLGGQAVSLADLAMADQAEGDLRSARLRYEQAKGLFEAGGYTSRAPAIDAALAALDEE